MVVRVPGMSIRKQTVNRTPSTDLVRSGKQTASIRSKARHINANLFNVTINNKVETIKRFGRLIYTGRYGNFCLIGICYEHLQGSSQSNIIILQQKSLESAISMTNFPPVI